MRRMLASLLLLGCGGSADVGARDAAPSDAAPSAADASPRVDAVSAAPQRAELWYSVDDRLVHIELDPANGSVIGFTASTVDRQLARGHNSLTMLDDGSLLGARLGEADLKTTFYLVREPSRSGEPVIAADLGTMPGGIMLEALYTDCDGRLYGMDTGEDVVSTTGNRLLRFTGDYLAGDLSFEVVTDLSAAVVADIDDMAPGIADNEITDNPGLAIDTGDVYAFDYDSGTGTQVATGGTYGIHALGGPLFDDGGSRLYLLSEQAELFALDPDDFSLSEPLGTGPSVAEGWPGWSGLTGPVTECDSGFVVD